VPPRMTVSNESMVLFLIFITRKTVRVDDNRVSTD